jgi:hypothetical protein
MRPPPATPASPSPTTSHAKTDWPISALSVKVLAEDDRSQMAPDLEKLDRMFSNNYTSRINLKDPTTLGSHADDIAPSRPSTDLIPHYRYSFRSQANICNAAFEMG